MGIPFYFASLIKKHKNIVSRVRSKLQPDILAVDFNCLIHNYIDDAAPIESVLRAIDNIMKECEPRKFLYIAMDGLVPYGKIVQQRYRRFRNAPVGVFDRNQISPGTPYMQELAAAVRTKFPTAVVSCTMTPGEGEHKIFEWMKTLLPDQRRSVCIYGLDADLILLALCQLNLCMPRSLWLLRENKTFQLESDGFSIMSVGALAEVLPLPVDQYVALCVLCFGNDFMPALGMFSLREGGHDRSLHIYEQSGSPDLTTKEGRRKFLETASKQEINYYREKTYARGKRFERAVVSVDGKHLFQRYNLHIMGGIEDVSYAVDTFWKCFQWTHHYFTQNACLDWNYVYPYSEAPLISQIIAYPETETKWTPEPPKFTITKQLQFILPQRSLRLTKKRVIHPDEYYNEETDTRVPWMRRYAWECEPLISVPSEDMTTIRPFQHATKNIPLPVQSS